MLLELEDIVKKRSDGYSLHIANLHVQAGEHVAIIGPSGSGKSTTLDIAGMILDVDSARSFKFCPAGKEYDIGALWAKGAQGPLAELRRKHLGYILQTGEIFGYLNVIKNIELTALAAGFSKAEARERATKLLGRLELESLATAMPHTLSIGQRQRVAIARALAPGPELILADEPTSALDPTLARKVMKLLMDAIQDTGASLIFVSHDHQLVSEFGFRKTEIIMHENVATLDE